jgi:hypothetical protein
LSSSYRLFDWLLLAFIVGLTLSTSYIHFYVGGLMLTLNSIGYLGLAALVVGSAVFYRRALPLVLVALAAYAVVTIVGWLIMGPYFDIAYLAKGIEIVLIASISFFSWRHRRELRDSIGWGRAMLDRGLGRGTGEGVPAADVNDK